MNKQRIAVTWEMSGYIDVEADSIEEAMEKVKENTDDYALPYDGGNYVDGSFWLMTENVEEMKIIAGLYQQRNDLVSSEILYRQQIKQYHIMDAEHQWEDYREANNIQDIDLDKMDYAAIAEEFENIHDCNIADNVQWQNIIANYIRDKKNK